MGAKALLCVLKSYANGSGSCWPSSETLCRDSGSDRKTIFKWIAELEKWRVLTRINRTIRGLKSSNQYSLEDEHFAKWLSVFTDPSYDGEKTGRGDGENLGHEIDPLNYPPSSRGEEIPAIIPFPTRTVKSVSYRSKS